MEVAGISETLAVEVAASSFLLALADAAATRRDMLNEYDAVVIAHTDGMALRRATTVEESTPSISL